MKSENRSQTAEEVSPIPEGYHTVTPFLVVPNAKGLIDFIEKGLGGKLEHATKDNGGTIVHATVRIGDSIIMIGEQPKESKDSKVVNGMLYLYVEDADAVYQKALKVKGTKSTREMRDEFYGDRSGCVADEWGNEWWISTHTEEVSGEEIQKRMKSQPSM